MNGPEYGGGDQGNDRGRSDDRGRGRPDDRGRGGGRAAQSGRGAPGRRDDRARDNRRDDYRPAGFVDAARWVAFQAISAVHRDDAYANLVLPKLLAERRLDGRDAAFATELTYGTLRLRGTIDAIIGAAAERAVDRIDPPARDALRLGVYQLLRLRVPPHAATNSTVDLVRAVLASAAGFANAVMRKAGAKTWDEWVTELSPEDEAGRLALVHAHPPWIVRAFADVLGSFEETAATLAADNEPAPVHLCARPGRITAAALAEQCGGTLGPYSPYAVHLPAGAPGDLPAMAHGDAHVQDEGSQLVALALATAPLDGGPDERWLDLCAGPGGKAALLGGLAAQRGARLTAVEVAEHRARLVEHATRGLPVDVVCADGREITGTFDRVLVDAPCTGLGALRRRPEARWRRQPGDLPALTRLQRELLAAALRVVRPGGVVAYATCSPHVAETRMTVTETCRKLDFDVDFVDARPHLPGDLPDLGTGPSVQLWPHRHGTDAMYLTLLRR